MEMNNTGTIFNTKSEDEAKEYEIKGDFMIYIVETFEDGKKISYKAEVDLNEMKETRKLM